MRHLNRRAFQLSAVVSALLFVATCVLCWRNRSYYDSVAWVRVKAPPAPTWDAVWLTSGIGSVGFYRCHAELAAELSDEADGQKPETGEHLIERAWLDSFLSAGFRRHCVRRGGRWPHASSASPGQDDRPTSTFWFFAGRQSHREFRCRESFSRFAIGAPHRFLFAATAAAPAGWLLRRRSRRRGRSA